MEKRVTYNSNHSYTTLNQLTPATKNIWVIFHGISQLSRHFIKPFEVLSDENYLIAPQAPAKHYYKGFSRVGASWLTKEDTKEETENLLRYLDAIYQAELASVYNSSKVKNTTKAGKPNLIVLGYSQGVSVVCRWLARRKLAVQHLIIYAGRIPEEITPDDLSFASRMTVHYIYGDRDEKIEQIVLEKEVGRTVELFPGEVKIRKYSGGHEVSPDVIKGLANL